VKYCIEADHKYTACASSPVAYVIVYKHYETRVLLNRNKLCKISVLLCLTDRQYSEVERIYNYFIFRYWRNTLSSFPIEAVAASCSYYSVVCITKLIPVATA
jgi:hypothetical protein